MWWNAPSDRDYCDPLGLDCDEDEAEICEDCGARWDVGEACEEWCETNRPVPEPGDQNSICQRGYNTGGLRLPG